MSDDNLDRPLWGGRPISKELGLTERQFYHKAEQGLLPVKKVGATYQSTRRRIRDFLNGDDREGA